MVCVCVCVSDLLMQLLITILNLFTKMRENTWIGIGEENKNNNSNEAVLCVKSILCCKFDFLKIFIQAA